MPAVVGSPTHSGSFWEEDKRRKPDRQGFDRALVVPGWEWFWEGEEGTWPFWDGGGLTVTDVGKHGRHATLVGSGMSWGTSARGRVVESDGSADSYINLGAADQFPMGATTGQPFTLAGLFTHPLAAVGTNCGWFDGTRAFQMQASGPDWRILYGISPFDTIGPGDDSEELHIAKAFVFTFTTAGAGKLYVGSPAAAAGVFLLGTDAAVTGDFTPVGVNFLVGARGVVSSGADGEMDMKTHLFLMRSVAWSDEQVASWAYDPFGPFRMVDEIEGSWIEGPGAVAVSTDSIIPILKRRRR